MGEKLTRNYIDRLSAVEHPDALATCRYHRTTGPGGSRKNAIIVADVAEEYALVQQRFGDEALVMEQGRFSVEGRRYDRLKIRANEERWTYLWFDITGYWEKFEKKIVEWRQNRPKWTL